MSSTPLRLIFMGSGPQLVECAERSLARGHTLVGAVSDCPQVTAWTRRRGIALCPLAGDVLGFVKREPYDYLISVVHHAIVAPEILATPSIGAINYHDSLLPEYAGFNATSWALLDGRSRHGVTWHQMTAEVDDGQVLAQSSFEIGEDDTAFTLSVKCTEAGVSSFAQLLEQLERRVLSGSPQGAGRSFNLRSHRPDVAVLQLDRSARELQRLVRALHLGPDDSWLAKPKLWLGEQAIAVGEAKLRGAVAAAAAPGTVLSLDGSGLTLASGDGALELSELSTLDGEPLDAAALRARFQLREGQQLPPLPPEQRELCREFDARATKHERFWLRRLHAQSAPRLSSLAPLATPSARARIVRRELPPQAAALAHDEQRAMMVAALAAFVVRTGEGGAFDLGLGRELPDALLPFYAGVTPLHFTGDGTLSFSALCDATRLELVEQLRRQSYARDIVQRYRLLRERAQRELALPVAVRLDGREAQVEGALLTLVLAAGGAGYAWVHDEGALSLPAAERLIARFDVLLGHALAEPQTELRRLALLPAAERDLLLNLWQDTTTPYEHGRCVHELFEAQVERSPEQTALVFRGRTLSYRELDQRANRVAHALRARGVGPEVLVGLCIERSLEMVVGLLGVLKAGGAYVPLDPVYPRDRLALMLEDAKVKVLLTQERLAASLPAGAAEVLRIEALWEDPSYPSERPGSDAAADNLAYVIFTSGSTGRPKGVMVQHGNAVNFFTGMDRALGHEQPGRWLAVTSISFDISVLELFWTLSRGFEVVIQEELDRASLAKPVRAVRSVSSARMGFGLFYFAAETGSQAVGGAYRLLLEGARFADQHDFDAVWTPERHFHEFGGLYPNPAVTTAALATLTKRVQLRAGSIVLPLHNPLRVAEDWAVIDHLAGGRIGLSFASGWHVNDFAFMPENYARRREIMLESIETVRRLWRGEKVAATNGAGQPIEVAVLPRPLNPNPPIWVASAGNVETFQLAGRMGFNVLTNMLGQDLADLRNKLRAYREARREHGHAGDGIVSVMLHTFVCDDTERARELARTPFSNYLASSFDLVKVAPWMFPAFKQPSRAAAHDPGFDPSSFTGEDMRALLDHAFDRYFDTAGLFGSPEHALEMVEQLKSIGANEVACLIDFGIDTDEALRGLTHLDRLRVLSNSASAHSTSGASEPAEEFTVGAQLARRKITHLQCTPSMARMLLSDPDARAALSGLKKLLLGGEALPRELADELLPLVGGEIINMYGPTETTVWSTTSKVSKAPITIGRPIANTVIRVLDANLELTPVGVPGELCIGGAGVVRGYLGRPELTAERFVQDPCDPTRRVYRTGDLVRYRDDGELEFLGRLDHQVKVNGYRIELGEIESALARHPSVRQSVVIARSDQGPAQLVAYLIAAGAGGPEQGSSARVEQWTSLWDETYKLATAEVDGARPDPRFNIAGWRDSFTGSAIPAAEMREWLDATVTRVLEHKPRRVLEIGCGTGMILFGLLPHVEHYCAVDVSPHALETIRAELTPAEIGKVTLVNQAAHERARLAVGSFDTVVINSVAQYFPDGDYLSDVLRQASELVVDGGRIFVGDVRNLAHLKAFHARAELTQAPDTRSADELAARIERRVRNEGELLLSESYFDALVGTLPRIKAADVQLKRGGASNEMACFRFDVTLQVGHEPPSYSLPAPALAKVETLTEIAARLADEAPLVLFSDVPNARLTGIYQACAELQAGVGPAARLRESFHALQHGVQPEALYKLHPAYDVDIRQARSGDRSRFDVLFRHKQHAPSGRSLFAALGEHALHNQPARASDADSLQQELREHLRRSLPEYMVPSLFVQLSAFPLTPNGKIDRKALPAPERAAPRASQAVTPPSGELEGQIAAVWQTVLQLESVGRSENIFDLGANSLLTVQAANRLSSVLGRKVSLVSMFRFPTVATLAAQLALEAGGAPASVGKRTEERDERRKDAAERRRQLRAERAAQGVRDE